MDIEHAIDELYAATPEQFVAERARLTQAAKAEGRADDARTLSKLRKPSLAAWVLNQLARQNRHDVDLLLDSGHRLREAQANVLAGTERDSFEQARRAERDALARLTKDAETLLKARGTASSSVLSQVAESLGAAAITEGGRELLARGRFTEPIRHEGFGVVSELAGTVAPARHAESKPPTRREEERAKAALREAKDRLREAEREARSARREAERLLSTARAADEKAEKAGARAQAAAKAVAEAESRLNDLRD